MDRSERLNPDIVRAEPHMAEALTRIAWRAKKFWGYDGAWMEAWREELTIRPALVRLSETWVALRGPETMGFYVLLNENGHGRLDHLWIDPTFMKMGVGSGLFRHALGRAHELGFAAVYIVSDPNAEAFYLKMGAHRVGIDVGSVGGEPRDLPILAISTA